MLRLSHISLCFLAFLVLPAGAWAQGHRVHGGGSSGLKSSGGGFRVGTRGRMARGGAFRSHPGVQTGTRVAGTAQGTATPAGRRGFGFRPFPNQVGPAHRSGFAFRLGNNVGQRAQPPVATHPGVGNINRPGVPPTRFPAPIPNINSPGGLHIRGGFAGSAFRQPSSQLHRRAFHFRGRRSFSRTFVGSGTIIYGMPYAVPYVVYITPPQPSEPPTPLAPPATEPSNVQLEYQPPAQPATVQPAVKPLTLLAFKDHTILAVTDYWLEGDMLYYQTSYGLQNSIPLDRLDLPLTEQLNRDRNVLFVLEPHR